MDSIIKIFHYTDSQIEIRTSGVGAQRLDEFRRAFTKLEKIIEDEQPDIVVIPGDIFEFWEANPDEQKLFAQHLHNIIPNCTRIIIIPGNHDVRQKGIALTSITEKRNLTDAIDVAITGVNSSKISYYQNTGLYRDSQFDITWAVWSQWDKHSMSDPKPAYSPWVNNSIEDVETSALIELFHDPVQGCKDFDGEPSKLFNEYKITLDSFKANTIIAGDIHAPDIIWFGENNERLFTYASSLVQRNFGEGDYWNEGTRSIAGNMQHGYNIISFNITKNIAETCEFKRLPADVSRHTIYLSQNFNYSTMIESLQIDPSEFNKIRVICEGNLKAFIQNEEKIVQHFKDNYNCSIELDHAKDVLDIEIDESEFDDISQVIDRDKMLDISKKYIDTIVDKTSTVDILDKEVTKDYIFKIFEDQLNSVDLTNKRLDIRPVRASISNFMSFCDDTSIDFKDTPLTIISGTNGVGKTNIIHFFKWMLSDKITGDQNDRNKKYNYSLLFNDSSENDVVSGTVDLFINGKLHKISKALTRTWKKGKKDITDVNWIDNLKGSPEMELAIQSPDFTSDNTLECVEYLNNICLYEELDKLVFINSNSLDALVDQKPEELASMFLDFLGLDVLNIILDEFDDLKESKLSKLAKPSLTVDQASEQIALSTSELKNIDEEIKKVEDEIIKTKDLRSNTQQTIDSLRSTLHQVPTLQKIEDKIDMLMDDLERVNDNKDRLNTTLDSFINEKSNSNKDTLIEERHNIELELSKSENAESLFTSDIKRQEEKISDAKIRSKKILEELKTKFSNELNELRVEDGTLGDKIADIKEAKDTLRSEYNNILSDKKKHLYGEVQIINEKRDSVNKLINEQKSWIQNFENSINLNNHKLEQVKTKIDELTNSRDCPTCGQPKTSEVLEQINELTKTLSDKIPELEEDNTAKKSNIERSTIKITELTADLEKFNNDKLAIQDRITILDDRFNSDIISGDENAEMAEKMASYIKDISQLNEKRQALKSKISEGELEIPNKVKNSEEIKEAIILITELNNELESVKIKLTDQKIITKNKNILVEDLNEKIKRILGLDDKINAINDRLKIVDTEYKETQSNIDELRKQEIFATKNSKILEEIKVNDEILNNFNIDLEVFEVKKATLKQQILNIDRNVSDMKKTIDEIKQYKLIDSSLKLYKKLLGKNGLPQYIFAHLIPLINKRLNESLEGVDFRLLFDQQTIQLRFYDLKKNTTRPVQFTSGMEKTIVGIALTKILRLMNNSKVFSILFIDEISGKLNNGKKLTYEAKNYQMLMEQFIIKLSETVNIYIVDHVLEFDNARIIEVQPTANGAQIKEI